MALRIITNDNDGTRNPGTRGAKLTTTTTDDDQRSESCVDQISTVVTGTESSFTTITQTTVVTETTTFVETTFFDDALDPSVERALLAGVLGDDRLGDGSRLPSMHVLQACQTGTVTAGGTLTFTGFTELTSTTLVSTTILTGDIN